MNHKIVVQPDISLQTTCLFNIMILYLHHSVHKKKKYSNCIHWHKYIHCTTTISSSDFITGAAHTSHGWS